MSIRPARDGGPASRDDHERPPHRPGVFIPLDVLAVAGIVLVGVLAAVLTAVEPALGIPVTVGATVIGLLFTMFVNWRGRHHG